MGSSYYPDAYGGRKIDYNWISELGDSISGAITKRRDENDLQNIVQQSGGDYNKLHQLLIAAGHTKEANSVASMLESQAMARYRNDTLAETRRYHDQSSVPDDVQLLNAWEKIRGASGPEPMRASEPQPSGVPGMSLQNAPGSIQEKLLPIQERKRLEAAGTGEGQRASARAGLEEAGPEVQGVIDQLIANTQEADDTTFQHALGPWQGAGEAADWKESIGKFLPQTMGAVQNYYDQGRKAGFLGGEGLGLHIKEPGELPGGFTNTVRDKINTTQASLVSILQRKMRVPGIGQQSDKELQQLMDQVGALNKSRDKADFYDRLSNVVGNFNKLGIPVSMPGQGELGRVQPTSAAVKGYTDRPPQETAQQPYDAAEPGPTMGSIGGEPAMQGPGAVPPPPPPGALNRLSAAIKAHPEAEEEIKAAFERQFGRGQPGYADHFIYGEGR